MSEISDKAQQNIDFIIIIASMHLFEPFTHFVPRTRHSDSEKVNLWTNRPLCRKGIRSAR